MYILYRNNRSNIEFNLKYNVPEVFGYLTILLRITRLQGEMEAQENETSVWNYFFGGEAFSNSGGNY